MFCFLPFCFRKNTYTTENVQVYCGSKWRQNILQAGNALKINRPLWKQLFPFASACFRTRRDENGGFGRDGSKKQIQTNEYQQPVISIIYFASTCFRSHHADIQTYKSICGGGGSKTRILCTRACMRTAGCCDSFGTGDGTASEENGFKRGAGKPTPYLNSHISDSIRCGCLDRHPPF